jgi:GTP cyclohydrolase I
VHGKPRHPHPGEETITSAMLGELQPNLGLRTEFLALARD